MTNPVSSLRSRQMTDWLKQIFPAGVSAIVPAAADASVRSYWRVAVKGKSHIVMDAPPEGFAFNAFLMQHRLLERAGAPVPQLLDFDADQGFALLEDLGDSILTPLLTEEAAGNWYLRAIDLLVSMQKSVDSQGMAPYDAAFLRRELDICREWYFGQQLGITLEDEALAAWERSCALIVARNLSQPAVFVHRDYHSRNLMVKDGRLRLIDYQDALHGPISYDLVSLLRDAYIEWDEAFVLDLAIRYWQKAREAGLPVADDFAEFYRDFEWQGLQRHLKVLGIFARLKYRDGKEQYQADIPRVLGYVRKVCERYAELGALRKLLAAVHDEQLATGYTF
ncbi:hypothetical protein SAMN05660284_01861 [Formivibrio citricus]|uniref:Aminoglycoside phosphotransferase domain-containing protein n=1 Tax=Formivibrio citricus TaxID=83765 RepID=A0A1I5ADT4_9NEIS|nr:phosphotransferase [Formivibrio citricus]SFN60369.1 hypothetical protein SAMN05660284_01861 [Formivibrio citricus]